MKLAEIDVLLPEEKERLFEQINALDTAFFTALKAALKKDQEKKTPFKPLQSYSLKGNLDDREQGMKMMREGKCACVILAGGTGSRLRFSGPKGCHPVSLVERKSLFQLHLEKVKAASDQVGMPLEIALMTSPQNHDETVDFLEKRLFFGLSREQVHFFSQGVWPLLDLSGNLFLEAPGQLAMGPSGNGTVFACLASSSILSRWQKSGITTVNFTLIDNPLALPFDEELFGFHSRQDNEVTMKAVFRNDSKESVGVLVDVEGHIEVVEYSELSSEEKEMKEDGRFKHPLANTSLFCFGLEFLEKASKMKLPLHRMKKCVKRMNAARISERPKEPNAWKFEEYIFDVLPMAKKSGVLVYPREESFAPLKNAEGKDSLQDVQKALFEADRRTFEQVTGKEAPKDPFDLPAEFYYPTQDFLERWKE